MLAAVEAALVFTSDEEEEDEREELVSEIRTRVDNWNDCRRTLEQRMSYSSYFTVRGKLGSVKMPVTPGCYRRCSPVTPGVTGERRQVHLICT